MAKTEPFYAESAAARFVANVAEGPSYSREISDFFADDNVLGLIAPFEETSALQVFAAYVLEGLLYEETVSVGIENVKLRASKLPRKQWRKEPLTPVDDALLHYGFDLEGGLVEFLSGKDIDAWEEDDVGEYFMSLRECGTSEELSQQMADRIFPVLFRDRGLVGSFNELVAGYVSELKVADLDVEYALLFRSDGELHPVSPPAWAKQMTAKRDECRCTGCRRDLSSAPRALYAPIVPLRNGGLNDVTNLQLRCVDCGSDAD